MRLEKRAPLASRRGPSVCGAGGKSRRAGSSIQAAKRTIIERKPTVRDSPKRNGRKRARSKLWRDPVGDMAAQKNVNIGQRKSKALNPDGGTDA